MALAGRGVAGGEDIIVLVDPGADGDMQVTKLGYSALGSQSLVQADVNGLLVQDALTAKIGGLSNARTTALDDILLVKASAGTLFGFQGYTDLDGYVQVIADADGTISGDAQALEVVKVTAPSGGGGGGPFSLDFGVYGIAIATGICIAFSSVGPTFTNGGNHMFVSAQYL